MKVGVFGGTFDPIHIGHLIAAEEARTQLDLDEVLFIPAGEPWLKTGRAITPGHHRLAMVELAVESNPYFKVLGLEIKRPGPTYTVDTLEELRLCIGTQAEFYLPLGLDSLRELGRWNRPERLLELCTVVGVSRPGSEDFSVATLNSAVPGASAKIRLLEGPHIGVVGSDLRRRVAEGRSIRYRVPDAVAEYIREHRLYL